MMTFLLLTQAEKLGQPKEALRLYGILQRYVDYYSYPMPEGLAVLRYRLFNGQTVYSCQEEMPEAARQFIDLINLYRDLFKDTGILGPAEAAFPAREKAVNFEKSDKNLAKCESLLVALMEEKLTDLEEAIHEETKPAVREATIEQLRTLKGQFLRLYRAILLNRGLLAWRRAEREGTNLERAYKHIYAAVTVNLPKNEAEDDDSVDEDKNEDDDFTDYPVVLEPVKPLLLLNFANALMVAGNSKAAASILRRLLPASKTITTSDASVYHLLADCHLRQYHDTFGRDKEEVAEIGKQVKGEQAKLLDVNWFFTPGMALRLYWKARHAVVHLLERNVLATEEAQATKQSEEYRQSVVGGRKATPSKKATDKWPEASPALTVAYLAMQRTFLEERLIQISLNIAYCNLLQSDFEDASIMIEQILAGNWPNFKVSPAALSQDAYLLAHLYAGEAAFESGHLQASLQKLNYESALSSFKETRSNCEDPSRIWRNYLNRQVPDKQTSNRGLPNCADKYTKEGSPLLEGLFSYNYLTVLANARQTERLPIRLARLRPNLVASKRSLAFFVAYLPMIPCRIRQIEENFARGRFTRQPKGESWRRKLESLQKEGKGLPACLTGVTSPLTKEQTDFLLHLAYNEKAINLVIPKDQGNRLALERSKEGKGKRTAGARLPVDPMIEFEARGKEVIDLSTLSDEEKRSRALDLTVEAYQTFKEGNFTKVNTILRGQLTTELFRLTPPHAHLDIRLWDAFNHFVLQRDVERLLAYLGGTVTGTFGPVGDLFDPETVDSVTRHVYNFAVILVSAKECKLDSWPANFAVTLLERYLWCEQAVIAGKQDDEAFYWATVLAESAAKRHVGSAFRTHFRKNPENGSDGMGFRLLELLDISQVVKILYFCIITTSEKFNKPKEAFKLYTTLRSYLDYFNYPLPRALSFTEYRLFTGQVHFSLSDQLERLKNSLLRQISQLSLPKDLTDKLKCTLEKVVTLVSKQDYESANRLLLQLDRQLLVKKKELAKVEADVEREADEGMKILLGDRLIEAKAAYLTLLRDIALYRALLAWHRLESEPGVSSIQPAFELLAEALAIASSPEPYSATIGPIPVSLLLHLANTALALEKYSIAISLLEACLPYAEENPLVSHRLGDCYLRQYLDLTQDDARISREIARWKENNHLPFHELEDIHATEASTESLKRARLYYKKAKEQVSTYLKSHFLEGEERRAEATFAHYQKVIFGCDTQSPSQDNCGEEKKAKKGKSAKKATKKGKGKKGKKGKSSKAKTVFNKKVQLIQEAEDKDDEDEEDGKADDCWVDDDDEYEQPSVVRNLDQDYVSMHRTFLEEMYVQLSLNLAYCQLTQRHYQQVFSDLLFLSHAPIPGGSPFALSQAAYLLACLYQGEAMYEDGQGKRAAQKFAYASALKRPFISGTKVDKRSIWRSDAAGNLTRVEASNPKTRAGRRLLENVFAYNYLTTLANMGTGERQPGPRLLRLRPNPIAGRNTQKFWLQAEKMLEYRQGQIRRKLAEGGFSSMKCYLKAKKEGDGESELEFIKRYERAAHPRVPARVQQREPLTAEQQDQLLLIVFSRRAESAKEWIPWDAKNPPLNNGETENPLTMNEGAREIQVKSTAFKGSKTISPKERERKPEAREIPTNLKEPEKCQTFKEMVDESKETEPESTVVEELESVNRFANLKILSENAEKLQKEAEMVQIETEILSNTSSTIAENVSVEFGENETKSETSELSVKEEIEPLDGVQPEVEAEIDEEGAKSESNYAASVTEGSANWDSVLKDFSNERWDLSEEEEDYRLMDVKIESKWAYLDEQLEMGADDEDDASEGSDKWDSACPKGSEAKIEEEEENAEWDDPQEDRLENDTFFGLPPGISQKIELSPVVTLSSTAVSPKALEATNEITNLLNKFKLENSHLPDTPICNESPPEISVPSQTPALVRLDLSELSALFKSLPEFNSQPPPQANQSLLSRYLSEQADGASTRASTPPPPGGFPFGPIGPPAHQAVMNENLYTNAHLEDEEKEDPSDACMMLKHHYRLMVHFENERKAHEREAKLLLEKVLHDQIRGKKERQGQSRAREVFEVPSGQQGNPSLPRFTDWRQSSPNLCQTMPGPMFGMPDGALFSGSQLGASTSMQGIDSLSMAPNFPSPFSGSSTNYPSVSGPTAGNSFGLSIDLNKDYFASPPPASGHSSVEPNLGIPPPPPGIWAQAPLRPPPGIGRPQTSPDRLKETEASATLSNLFGSLQMQKPN